MASILPFRQRVLGRPTTTRASVVDILRGRITEAWGSALNRLGVPGFVRSARVHDDATGADIEIRVGHLYTVFSVDGRDYFFRRTSGEFDGTGTAIRHEACALPDPLIARRP